MTPAGWRESSLVSVGANISDIKVNNDGSLIYLKTAGAWYCYETASKALRKINLEAATAVRVTEDNRLVVQDANYRYLIYDPVTDTAKDIRPADANNPPNANTLYFDVDASGSKIAYVAQNSSGNIIGVKTKYIDGAERPESYLLSFDGKKSWHSCKDGNWILAKTGLAPTKEDFDRYGMTADEVNGLTAVDYGKLYQNGRDIYSVDVALCFASTDAYTTPRIKSITVDVSDGGGAAEQKTVLYAAKKQDFDGAGWRKVRKIYPVELSSKNAEFYYLIKRGNDYKVYKEGAWRTVTGASSYLTNIEANWIDITLEGMKAAELRSIPEVALTNELGGRGFSVVYCLKVGDESTGGHTALFNIDYVEKLFTGSDLTIDITYNDGSAPARYTNLTPAQIEDFMEWVNGRQKNIGPVFYRINNGSVSDFVNYYMIQNVRVTSE